VTVQDVEIPRPIDIDPPAQAEAIHLLAAFGTEVIKERLDMLFHFVTEFGNDRFVQFEEIKRVVPPARISPPRRVAIILEQPSGEFLQSLVQSNCPGLTTR